MPAQLANEICLRCSEPKPGRARHSVRAVAIVVRALFVGGAQRITAGRDRLRALPDGLVKLI